jgi:hypothetical protein
MNTTFSIKTNCGESITCFFSKKNTSIIFQAEDTGSQFISLIKKQVVHILNNKKEKYIFLLEKIFWRITKVPFSGKKKEDIKNILFQIKSQLLLTIKK